MRRDPWKKRPGLSGHIDSVRILCARRYSSLHATAKIKLIGFQKKKYSPDLASMDFAVFLRIKAKFYCISLFYFYLKDLITILFYICNPLDYWIEKNVFFACTKNMVPLDYPFQPAIFYHFVNYYIICFMGVFFIYIHTTKIS